MRKTNEQRSTTLYKKIALVFAFVFSAGTLAQFFVSAFLWEYYYADTIQRNNQDLAADIAAQLRVDQEEGRLNDLQAALLKWAVMNPTFDFYFLTAEGRIAASSIAFSQLKKRRVDVAPLDAMLGGFAPDLPIYSDNPNAWDKKEVFSVARISFIPGVSYLYLVLDSSRNHIFSHALAQKYVILGSIAAFVLLIVVTVLIGLALFRYLTRNLRTIAHAAQSFEQGRFDQRVELSSTDELGDVARAFNMMAGTIAAQIERLKRSDHLRRSFIANAAHDLRRPLTVIRGFIELLDEKKQIIVQAGAEPLMAAAYEALLSEQKLVDELFELAKLEARESLPKHEPLLVSSLLEVIELSYGEQAAEKGMNLHTRCSPEDATVLADRFMIQRVLANLVENAILHGTDATVIEITAGQTGREIEFSIRDNGKGIPAAALPNVFEPFVRASDEYHTGSGLGLAIVRRILEAHGSKIDVESSAGNGTCFHFRLQTAQPAS